MEPYELLKDAKGVKGVEIQQEPKAPEQDFGVKAGGRRVGTFEDMMNSTSIFGGIGDKYTLEKQFDEGAAYTRIAPIQDTMKDFKKYEEGYIDAEGRKVTAEEFDQIYFSRAEEKLNELKTKPITEEFFIKVTDKLPNEIVVQLNTDGVLHSQYDFAKRLYYLQDKEREAKHVAQDADLLDYLGAFAGALTDVDSLVTLGSGSVFKATKTGAKVFSIAERNKVKSGMLIGSSQAVMSQYGYDMASGTEATDKTYMYSAAFGGALGTTAGWVGNLLTRKNQGSKYIVTNYDGTKTKVTKEDILTKEIEAKQKELDSLEAMKTEAMDTHVELKTTFDDVVNQTEHLAKQKKGLEALKTKEEYLASEGHLTEAVKKAEKVTKKIDTTVNNIVKTKDKLQTKLIREEESLKTKLEHNKARDTYEKSLENLKKAKEEKVKVTSEIKDLTKKSKALEKLYKEKPSKKILKDIETVKSRLSKLNNKIIDLDVKLKEKPINVRPKKDVTKHKETIKTIKSKLASLDKEHKALVKDKENKVNSIMKEAEDKSKNSARMSARISKKLKALTYDYKSIVTKQEQLKKELYELKKGIVDTSKYQKEVLSAKEKLVQELEEYTKNPLTLEKLEENPMFQSKARGWLRKVAISPTTRLYESDNPYVRSLVSISTSPVVDKEEFVNNLTAKAMAREWQDEAQKTLQQIDSEYRKYVENGGREYSQEQWFYEVAYQRAKAIGEQKQKIISSIESHDLDAEAMAKAVEEKVSNYSYKFDHENEHLSKSMEVLEKFNVKVRDAGKELKLKGLEKGYTGYVTQLYSEKKAIELDEKEFVDFLVKAQQRWARDHKVPEDLEEFKALATTAYKTALSENQRYDKMFREFAPDNKRGGTSRLHERSIRIYEDDMAELMDENIALNTLVYGRSIGGKLAIKKFYGAENKQEIAEKLKAIPNINKSDLDDLSAIIDTIGGYREATSYETSFEKVIHGASTVTSALHMLGFGLTSLTEISNVVANTGFVNTLKNITPSFKLTMKAYKGKLTEDDYIHMSILKDIGMGKFQTAVNRFDVEGSIDKVGWVQGKLDTLVQKEATISGLRLFTDWFKVTAQMASHDFIAKAAKNVGSLSQADVKRLNTIGVSQEDLMKLRDYMWKDGKFQGLNKDKWGDELNERIELATKQQVFNSILHPDGTTLPRIMTEGSSPLTRVLNDTIFKFLKFPVASYEALLLKGMSNFDAKVAVGTALNASLWAGIILAKDKLNNPDKPRYDLDTDEGKQKLLKDVMMNISVTSGPMVGANWLSAITQQKSIQGYDKSIGDAVTFSDISRMSRGDIPLNIGPFKFMKILENLDLVNSTYTYDVKGTKSYSLGGKDE